MTGSLNWFKYLTLESAFQLKLKYIQSETILPNIFLLSAKYVFLLSIFLHTNDKLVMVQQSDAVSTNILLVSYFYFPVISRSSPPEVFLEKGDLKTCSKFTGEHPCQSAISIKLQYHYILHIFRTPFPKNTSGRLLLYITCLKAREISCESDFILSIYSWVPNKRGCS